LVRQKKNEISGNVIEKIGPITLPLATNNSKVVNFHLTLYRIDNRNYHVLVCNPSVPSDIVLLRIESACTFAHLYGSKLCDCEQQLKTSLSMIGNVGGILIYALDQHGRGVGLVNHVRVYQVEQTGIDTVEAHKTLGLQIDARHYMDALKILHDMKISKIRLLTNNPSRIDFFRNHLEHIERLPLEHPLNPYEVRELMIKKEKMGHLFSFKSDFDWLLDINKSHKVLLPFAVIENSISRIFGGDLISLIEFLKNLRLNHEVFYTIYCSQEMSSPAKVKKLILLIMKENLTSHYLRIVGCKEIDLDKFKGLYNLAVRAGFLELKCIKLK